MEIRTTKDYTIFSIHPLNRDINENHVKALMLSMTKRLAFTFITCNNKMQIIDGQHRFEALKRLGMPINYIVSDTANNEDMILQNTNQKNWNLENYVLHYAKADYKYYVDLVKFQQYYKFPFSLITALISNSNSKILNVTKKDDSSMTKIVKSGDLTFDKYKLIKRLDMLKDCNDILKKGIKRSMLGGLNWIMNSPNYNHDRMIKALNNYPQLFEPKRTAEDYIELFEMIYNYHQKTKVNLRYIN